jgi:hypothetical protein
MEIRAAGCPRIAVTKAMAKSRARCRACSQSRSVRTGNRAPLENHAFGLEPFLGVDVRMP